MNTLLKKDLRVMMTGILMFISCLAYSNPGNGTKEKEDVYKNLPFSMPEVSKPSFPDYEVNIRDFGALSDGVTLNTEAINNAIKTVSSKGGGKVIIPEGLWLTGPVVLLSNVNLYTEKNALIVFSSDTSLYPIIEASFEGLDTKRCQSPISAMNAENIAITGSGVFDGAGDRWRPVKKDKMTERQWKNLVSSGGKVDENGKVWYPDAGALKASVLMTGQNSGQKEITDEEWIYMKSWLRPVMLSIVKSKRILLEGVTFNNSPGLCIHPLSCESLTLNDVKVFNPWYSQNGDALDVESCKNVLVTNIVLLIKYLNKSSAYSLTVINCNSAFFVNVDTQIPVLTLFNVIHIKKFYIISFNNWHYKLFCLSFIIFSLTHYYLFLLIIFSFHSALIKQ